MGPWMDSQIDLNQVTALRCGGDPCWTEILPGSLQIRLIDMGQLLTDLAGQMGVPAPTPLPEAFYVFEFQAIVNGVKTTHQVRIAEVKGLRHP